jgi:hypothetical protein
MRAIGVRHGNTKSSRDLFAIKREYLYLAVRLFKHKQKMLLDEFIHLISGGAVRSFEKDFSPLILSRKAKVYTRPTCGTFKVICGLKVQIKAGGVRVFKYSKG